MISPIIVLVSLLAVVRAANDWNNPCFNGECSWDLPATNADGTPGASGTMIVKGSSDAITDISTASGWMILDCDPNGMAQDIRMVCNSTDPANNGCAHMMSGGPEGKLVRLPANCGKMPFAMISKSWVHADQSIPASMKAKIARRDGATPTVRGLSVDMKFPTTPKSGNVSLFVQGATLPGSTGNFTQTPSTAPQRRSRLSNHHKRGFFDFIPNIIKKVEDVDSFSKNLSTTLPPIDVNKDFTLLDANVDCGGSAGGVTGAISANIKSDLLAQAHAVVTIGAAANGTIVPPLINDFVLFANVNSDINSTLTITGTASGTLDSGQKTVFEVGIPGLDFPGIFTLGPSFKVNAQAKAELDLDIDMKVNLAYKITNGQLIFPANANFPGGGNFAPADAPLKISVSPNIQAEAKLEAHVIPTVDFGIDALGGLAQATVFLNLDASATLDLTVNAGGNATVVDTTKNATAAAATNGTSASNSTSAAANGTAKAVSPKVSNSTSANTTKTASKTKTISKTSTQATTAAKTSVAPATATQNNKREITANGCVDLQGGLSVNAGATGSFFGFFNAGTQVSLFNKKFNLFKKCFGSATANSTAAQTTRRSFHQTQLLQARAGLSCLSGGTPKASSLVDQLLSGGSILPI